MSFRLFVYYCALCGGWAALFGWTLGKALAPNAPWARAALLGMFLGLAVAVALGTVDAVFNLSLQQPGKVLVRALGAMLVGCIGGLVAASLGHGLYYFCNEVIGGGFGIFLGDIVFILGWTFLGLIVGTAVSLPGLLLSLSRRQDVNTSVHKLGKCAGGGLLGGLLGGIVAWALTALFSSNTALWSPTAIGFVAMGALIGLLVGLAQVILKEAWVKVEAGFRPGREILLAKEATHIGRAEASDIALYGDPAVEKTHATIVKVGPNYYLDAVAVPGTTFVNDHPVTGRTALKTGDLIRVGNKSLLRFNERPKKGNG